MGGEQHFSPLTQPGIEAKDCLALLVFIIVEETTQHGFSSDGGILLVDRVLT